MKFLILFSSLFLISCGNGDPSKPSYIYHGSCASVYFSPDSSSLDLYLVGTKYETGVCTIPMPEPTPTPSPSCGGAFQPPCPPPHFGP